MVAPKNLIRQLYKYWESIEHLVRLSRESPAFEQQVIERVINQHNSSDKETNVIFADLVNADILQSISRTDSYQLNPLVLDFTRGLTHELELGLSAVLKARVDAIRQATAQLLKGLDANDNDLLRSGSGQLAELTRKIELQLKQDRHAIFEIAEMAKSANTSIPIERRYRDVLDAYDQYVEPMNEMMDSGLEGNFYLLLEEAESALDRVTDALSMQGVLYGLRVVIRQIGYQIKELRYQGRVIAQQCADTLLPLRDEVRQHNKLSAVISKLLGEVRKKGLSGAIDDEELPRWQRERSTKVQLGNEVRELMADFMNFQPATVPFPEDVDSPSAEFVDRVDKEALLESAQQSLPIKNLMVWLKENYGEHSDSLLLSLYHELVCDTRWKNELGEHECSIYLHKIAVTYYPHQLVLSTDTLLEGNKNAE